MPILGVDLDGVLADLIGYFILSEALETKHIYDRKQFVKYYFSENIDEDVAKKWKLWLVDEVKMMQLLPYSENVYALKFLDNARWKIHIITSRQPHLETITKEWLYAKGVPFHKLFLVDEKKKYIDDCDFFVDDKVDNVVLPTTAKTYLMRRSWNKQYWDCCSSIKSLWDIARLDRGK